jgi:hypothetical protein
MHVVARQPARVPFHAAASPEARHEPRVPHGFVRIEDVRSLPMRGHWSPLADGMPPWLPFHALLAMSQREHAGDDSARAWLDAYRRAVQGDIQAQARIAGAFERGDAGVAPDAARAFFFYYRAGLGGDDRATAQALRLKETLDIPSAAMEEPRLVYPGPWRWWREEADRPGTRIVVELAADGRCSGGGANGLWSYDAARRIVTLAHHETWHVRIVACRETTLFGQDARGAPCIIERTLPSRRP